MNTLLTLLFTSTVMMGKLNKILLTFGAEKVCQYFRH